MISMTGALPEIFLALAGLLILLLGAFRGDRSFRLCAGVTVAAFAGAAFLVVRQTGTIPAFGGMFLSDDFARFAKVLILGAAGASVLMSLAYLEKIGHARPEYPVLLLFSALGMMVMVSATDMLTLYAGLELQSLALYILAAFRRDHVTASEAGLKYFVLGAISSGMLLYGLSLLYGFSGSTRFAVLAADLAVTGKLPLGAYVGFGFALAGLAFKISAVPFHMWTPDVYEQAPTCVTAFFASSAKVAALALLVRLWSQPFAGVAVVGSQVLWALAVASMLLGSIGGLVQIRIKRLLAYSAMTNMGTALIGLVIGGADGVAALLIYLALYCVNTLGVFGVLHSMRRQGQMVDTLADLGGLSKTHPGLAALMAFFMFSLAGVPPLAGFFGKYFVFLAAVQQGAVALALVGVLASVLAAAYYLKVVKALYFDEASGESLDAVPEWSLRLVTGGAALLVCLFILCPSALTDQAARAAHSLWGG